MPHYFRKEEEIQTLKEDETPIHNYSIDLSERDVEALQSLKRRNGAGIGNIMVENIALWKMINQVCDLPKISNVKHPDWLV